MRERVRAFESTTRALRVDLSNALACIATLVSHFCKDRKKGNEWRPGKVMSKTVRTISVPQRFLSCPSWVEQCRDNICGHHHHFYQHPYYWSICSPWEYLQYEPQFYSASEFVCCGATQIIIASYRFMECFNSIINLKNAAYLGVELMKWSPTKEASSFEIWRTARLEVPTIIIFFQ